MKRAVVAGYYGFGNAGDELILKSILSKMARQGGFSPLVLSRDPEGTAAEQGAAAVDRWSLFQVAAAILRSDLVILGGGGLLQDATSRSSLWYYLLLLWIAKLLRKEVWVWSVGAGPIRHPSSRRLIRSALRLADRITVRDPGSLEALRGCGVEGEIGLAHDPVLDLPLPESGRGGDPSRPRVLFILRRLKDAADEDRCLRRLAEVARRLGEELRAEVLALVFQPDLDHAVLERFLNLAAPARVRALAWNGLDELIASLRGADLVVTQRYHGALLAARMGIPVAGVAVDPKIPAFLREIGGTESDARNVLELERCEANQWMQVILACWKERDRFQERIGPKLESLRARGAVFPSASGPPPRP